VKNGTRFLGVLLLAMTLVGASASVAVAANMAPVNLRSTASFGVLAHHVDYVGTSNVTGDFGAYHIWTEGGILNVTGVRTVGEDESLVTTALADLHLAWEDAMGRTPTTPVVGQLGDGQTLLPGVYGADSLDVTGTLILDGLGDPDSVFVFQTTGAFTTQPGSHIELINGARFCRVFWAVRNADLGANSHFEGHLLSEWNIIARNGASVNGQLMASAGTQPEVDDIELSSNTITNVICTPRLPKTGYPPQPFRLEWPIAGGVLALAVLALVSARLRARASH
jgi:hypothetical protein